MKRLVSLALLGVMLSSLALAMGTAPRVKPANTNDWPSWRGPNANGVAPEGMDPPIKWSETSNIKWKAALSGSGSATPIVLGNQVIVLSAGPTERIAKPDELPKPDPRFESKTTPPNRFYRFEVSSYNRQDGSVLWRKTANEAVPHEGHHPTHSYAAGSPVTDGERFYACFGSFGLYAYDLKGELLWKRDLGRLRTRFGWGEAVTPVVHGDAVILNWDQEADSKLIVLDKLTGNTKWEVTRDERSSWNTPFVVEQGDKTQIIINGTKRIRAHDLADGKVLWETGGMTVNPIPSVVAEKGVAYIVSGYKGAAAVAVKLDAQGDLGESSDKILWRYGKGTPYVPSPILVDGRIYMTKVNTQLLTVLNAVTGKALVEDMRLPKVTNFYGSPVAAKGRLYFADRDGNTVVLSSAEKPSVLAVNSLDDHFDASPALSGKMLLLRGEKYLYAIEAP